MPSWLRLCYITLLLCLWLATKSSQINLHLSLAVISCPALWQFVPCTYTACHCVTVNCPLCTVSLCTYTVPALCLIQCVSLCTVSHTLQCTGCHTRSNFDVTSSCVEIQCGKIHYLKIQFGKKRTHIQFHYGHNFDVSLVAKSYFTF